MEVRKTHAGAFLQHSHLAHERPSNGRLGGGDPVFVKETRRLGYGEGGSTTTIEDGERSRLLLRVRRE